MSVSSMKDVIAIEQSDPDPFNQYSCTFDLIRNGAAISPDAPALSFIVRTEDYASPVSWTYSEWLSDITRTANMLRRMGLQKGDVVA